MELVKFKILSMSCKKLTKEFSKTSLVELTEKLNIAAKQL